MKNNKKCKAQCKASSGCKGWTRYKSGEYKGWCGLTTADTSCVEEDATFDSGVLECWFYVWLILKIILFEIDFNY